MPISITPALGNVLEILIKDQIDAIKIQPSIKSRVWIQKKFSTIDALVFLTEIVRQNFMKKVVTSSFLDL